MLTISMIFEEEDPRKKNGLGKYLVPGLIGTGIAGLMGYGGYKYYQDQHRYDDVNRDYDPRSKEQIEADNFIDKIRSEKTYGKPNYYFPPPVTYDEDPENQQLQKKPGTWI